MRRACIPTRRFLALVYATMLLSSPRPTPAQPVEREVLDYVDVERSEQTVAVRIHFRFPVNYVRHFPYESGDTLLIHVTTTAFEARDETSAAREALRPPDDPDVPLTDIVYDARTLWSPYLMLHFSRRVDFRVRPGDDARSIVVELPLAAAPGASPSPSNTKEQTTP